MTVYLTNCVYSVDGLTRQDQLIKIYLQTYLSEIFSCLFCKWGFIRRGHTLSQHLYP